MSDLNVFTYGYSKGSRFIFENIRQFFRNIKYAWQRATRGFCDFDTWDLDHYYTELLRDSLYFFADHTHGYPGDEEPGGKTYEEWQEYIRTIASLLNRSIERPFDNDPYYPNKYEEEYSKYLEQRWVKSAEREDGAIVMTYNATPEQDKLVNKYFKESEKIYKLKVKDRNKALDMMKARWDNLWD